MDEDNLLPFCRNWLGSGPAFASSGVARVTASPGQPGSAMRRVRGLLAGLAGGLVPLSLAACSGLGGAPDKDLLTMIDCDFRLQGAVHLHVSEERGTASVVSDYKPGGGEHANALREGRESKGTLAPPGASRYRIDVFLRNDPFGSRPNEVLRLILERDGQARFEAQAPGQPVRLLDRGSCIDAD